MYCTIVFSAPLGILYLYLYQDICSQCQNVNMRLLGLRFLNVRDPQECRFSTKQQNSIKLVASYHVMIMKVLYWKPLDLLKLRGSHGLRNPGVLVRASSREVNEDGCRSTWVPSADCHEADCVGFEVRWGNDCRQMERI